MSITHMENLLNGSDFLAGTPPELGTAPFILITKLEMVKLAILIMFAVYSELFTIFTIFNFSE